MLGHLVIEKAIAIVRITVLLVVVNSVFATTANAQIRTKISDPFIKPGYIETLLEALNKPYPYQWESGTTLKTIRDDLAKEINIRIDHVGLGDLGMNSDHVIADGDEDHSGPTRSSTAVDSQSIADETPRTWWRKKGKSAKFDPSSIGSRLFNVLKSSDLTLSIQSGQLMITTSVEADVHLITSVFDVTELIARSKTLAGKAKKTDELMELIQTHVSPESWEYLGGTNAMSLFELGGRIQLVASTTLVNHWRVKDLLESLR